MSELAKNMHLLAEDPMWDAHAEVPKKLLTKAVARIEALEAALREIIKLDGYDDIDRYVMKIARAALDKDAGK